ncbi:arginine--tRNA ligase [candidate division WOR-1 bacterium RIFOXYB2_FULL_42_35]|uniref:Arginine--tRNA ligase n=1 Tax=candidate division WOR-1 bacterium RIFOXYC2_FULL_41_25 TaxID=1802586 RepID=A0A1F4TMZ9_UNCSA|nr:MAG: arginine--tRNA ligase [candidate division WOR-1 bacterium RIFOXYA2_FULL_41_14]OGC24484.1 MAG: arginine--tRNA ligase [candidate division WOR-1 bacterium RIFOXYB2_FULL_42_35]OGC34101.1 MAG: arginine--tRNA ligase [candidate division WOR-1 bacterium RIFOXYC2_FULL_41_25]OGC42797.1 MAG: arginine--tRNA ligase [candidate division WOR-1 bacterium RIFOXYD2_FULL_41_8]
MKHKIAEIVKKSLKDYQDLPEIAIDIPRNKNFGDYSCNIALILAKKLEQNPREIASKLVEKLKEDSLFEKVAIAGPGFINFTLKEAIIQDTVKEVIKQDHDWGKLATRNPQPETVLLEYVSANPTGPLHVGHGRWAVVGDAIARLLRAAGYEVKTEYYVNNVGNQIDKLIASVKAAKDGKPTPEGGYGGAYIQEIAKQKAENSEEILASIIEEQKKTLGQLGVAFDNWFDESQLHDKNEVKLGVAKLHDLGMTFEEGGAIWFKSQELGDDKNRVLIRENGNSTYFSADIAYHLNKFSRADHLIDIWGTDHHGYVARLKAALKVMGLPVDKFEVIIGQLVTLYRGKEAIRMSKRTGEMVTLQEVVDEIGTDATRFFFSATDVNSHLDFDLELAKKKSNDNPVFYVQYAHARVCSILEKNKTAGLPDCQTTSLKDLKNPAERALMLKLISWPDIVQVAARLRHPQMVTEYGKELAALFHSFYEQCQVLGNPARVILVDASRIVLRNVLEMLAISAPEKM